MHGVVVHIWMLYLPIFLLRRAAAAGGVRAGRAAPDAARGGGAPVEHRVERRDLVHEDRRHFAHLRRLVHGGQRQPAAVLLLRDPQHRDARRLRVVARVLGQHVLDREQALRRELERRLLGVVVLVWARGAVERPQKGARGGGGGKAHRCACCGPWPSARRRCAASARPRRRAAPRTPPAASPARASAGPSSGARTVPEPTGSVKRRAERLVAAPGRLPPGRCATPGGAEESAAPAALLYDYGSTTRESATKPATCDVRARRLFSEHLLITGV